MIVFPGSGTLRLSSEEMTTMLEKLKAAAPTGLRREPRSRDGKIEKKENQGKIIGVRIAMLNRSTPVCQEAPGC